MPILDALGAAYGGAARAIEVTAALRQQLSSKPQDWSTLAIGALDRALRKAVKGIDRAGAEGSNAIARANLEWRGFTRPRHAAATEATWWALSFALAKDAYCWLQNHSGQGVLVDLDNWPAFKADEVIHRWPTLAEEFANNAWPQCDPRLVTVELNLEFDRACAWLEKHCREPAAEASTGRRSQKSATVATRRKMSQPSVNPAHKKAAERIAEERREREPLLRCARRILGKSEKQTQALLRAIYRSPELRKICDIPAG